MVQFYIDGTLYENPSKWEEINERIYRADELGGYLLELKGKLDFYGGAYQYLRAKFEDAICDNVEVEILESCADGNYKSIFKGLIFISDIEWNIVKCFATVELVDNSYIAKIFNNKGIKTILGVHLSKNQIDISAYDTQQTNIALLKADGTAGYTNRFGYRLFDAFKYLVAFMTDGTVGFASDFFDYSIDPTVTLSAPYYTVLMDGNSIRNGVTSGAFLSFEDLYIDVSKIFNLAFSIETDTSGNPVMRIENKDYYKQETSINYFEYPADILQQIQPQSLYSKVKFGSAQVSTTFTYLQDIKFLGQQQEEYFLRGDCNSDSVLNLQLSQLITDCNIIQDLVNIGTTDGFDKSNFLVVLNYLNVSDLNVAPGTVDYFYNRAINNLACSVYWANSVPSSIVLQLGTVADEFKASRATSAQSINDFVTGTNIIYNDDSTFPNYDTGGNYSTITGAYTAPLDGTYAFYISNFLLSTSPISPQLNSVKMKRYNSINVLQETIVINGGVPFAFNQTYNLLASETLLMYAGDYVIISLLGMADVLPGSIFQCVEAVSGGGEYQTYGANEMTLIDNSFDYNISCDMWATIKETPFKNFTVKYDNGMLNGWVKEFSRKLLTGETKVTINSKPNG